ncbi:AGAP007278-PA-like protein [Anopheles sinensis]|uniref:AGAP007278-PA-like protein n=1 Tax=Anopheles sinensis TaxID=74873 RepID=A0A084VJ00_ANOSI|nr:AGAP007278-PA-like protein [Anopheles sinensis]
MYVHNTQTHLKLTHGARFRYGFTAPNKRRFGSGARKDDHAATDASNDGEQSGADANGGGAGAKSLIGRLGRSRFALKQ